MKNEHAKTVKLKISIDRAGIASLKRLFRELGKLNTRIEATSTEVIRAIVHNLAILKSSSEQFFAYSLEPSEVSVAEPIISGHFFFYLHLGPFLIFRSISESAGYAVIKKALSISLNWITTM
ncbi:MAG TPA: hypothetical protein VLH56_06185 [Dissulfurispiraceae bacterium]|nr:hypothetical protein [Dissulfurispiraceae bacterium]